MNRSTLVMISVTVLFFGAVSVARQPVGPEAVLIKDGQNQLFVRAVLARSGDEVALSRGVVVVNGQATNVRVQPDVDWGPKLVEPNTYFVAGDPAGLGNDTRSWGLVTERRIVGTVQIGAFPRQ